MPVMTSFGQFGTNDFIEYWTAFRLFFSQLNAYDSALIEQLQRPLGWSEPTPVMITTTLVVGIYLCFSPYLGSYDQLLIVRPVLAALQPASLNSRTLAFAVIGSLSFSLSSFQPLVVVFVHKLFLFLSFAGYFIHRSKNRTPILPPPPTKEETGPVIDFSFRLASDIHGKGTR